jgi:hypothetical protein
MAARGRQISPPRTIIEAPIAQITWAPAPMVHRVEKYHPKLITVTSSRISQSPRVRRKRASSPRVRRVPAIQELAPARKTKTEVGGIEAGLGEIGPDVIQHHDDHDQPAQQIYMVESPAGSGGHRLDAVCPRSGLGEKHRAHVVPFRRGVTEPRSPRPLIHLRREPQKADSGNNFRICT